MRGVERSISFAVRSSFRLFPGTLESMAMVNLAVLPVTSGTLESMAMVNLAFRGSNDKNGLFLLQSACGARSIG